MDLNPHSPYSFTQFSLKQSFSGSTITIALQWQKQSEQNSLSSLHTLSTLFFESALNKNSLDSSRHVTPSHLFMHFLKMFRFCSPVSQASRTTVSLEYKAWKYATALQLPFAGRLLIWEHCTDLQFIFLTVLHAKSIDQ